MPCAHTGEHFFIVMRKYGGNLRQWRLALPADPALQLRLYLNIFADVARAVQVSKVGSGSASDHRNGATSKPSVRTGNGFAAPPMHVCHATRTGGRPLKPHPQWLQALHEANVVHFDIKCDNVQLEPLPAASPADIAAPPTAVPTFRVVLVDFGESKDFGTQLHRIDPNIRCQCSRSGQH